MRARYFSNMGHFSAIWLALASEVVFLCFQALGDSFDCARGTLATCAFSARSGLHSLRRSFFYVFKPGRALLIARARYFSNMGHFGEMRFALASEVDFLCLQAWAGSFDCARGTLATWAISAQSGLHSLRRLFFYVFRPWGTLLIARAVL